ncbi:MAG: NHL repeat-containing protein, partial [Acidiferrobacterales bacterium]
MTRKTVLKITGGVAGSLLGFIIIAWLVWVPWAQEPGYVFVAAWGEPGPAPGQFNDPTGIAIAGNEVFVSDARNGRIQVFDLDGKFKRQFGSKGDGPGQLGRPMNLTIAGDELYVADYWNDRIQVFGLDGTPHRLIGRAGSGPGEFDAPGGVAVAANGDLFVVDFYNQRVQHLRADGSFIKQWGETGEIGVWAGQFNYPTDVVLAADGTLFVADGYGDRVQVFATTGRFLRKWGGPFAMNIFGPFNGWFTTVTSIALDRQGNVFVADFYNNRVQKFAPDGTFLTAFGESGQGPGQFDKA